MIPLGRHGTIAGRKAAQDAKRAAIFTKYGRLISVAAKDGADPDYNPALRQAIDKAKGMGMPNDNIDRAIKKGSGELGGQDFENITFEGYGPSGVAIIVETLTDNRNRTTANVKHAFDKYNGSFGVPGCVSYMFSRKGVFIFDKEDGITEDDLMELALDAGADDIVEYEDSFEVSCGAELFSDISDVFEKEGLKPIEADIVMVPSVESSPEKEEDIKDLKKIIELLEGDDDVQNVFTNSNVDLS